MSVGGFLTFLKVCIETIKNSKHLLKINILPHLPFYLYSLPCNGAKNELEMLVIS